MSNPSQSLHVQKIVAGVSILLFLIKIYAWYVTHSVAILTDAIESIVNVVAGLLGVYSLMVSARPKDKNHPYGHGKVEFITSGIEGTLISIAGVYIMIHALLSFFKEGEVQKLDLGLILIAATGFINYIAGRVCVRIGRKNNSLALIAGGKHLITDTYTTIGILVGLLLLYITGYWWIDKVVAIIFSGIIIVTGYKILRQAIAGIMDETDKKLVEKLIERLQQKRRVNWIDLHNLRVIKYGPTIHIDCHVTVPWYFNVHEAHEEIDQISKIVEEDFGTSVELFIHADGCLPTSCSICQKMDCPVRKQPFESLVIWNFENVTNNAKHQIVSLKNN